MKPPYNSAPTRNVFRDFWAVLMFLLKSSIDFACYGIKKGVVLEWNWQECKNVFLPEIIFSVKYAKLP